MTERTSIVLLGVRSKANMQNSPKVKILVPFCNTLEYNLLKCAMPDETMGME